MKIEEVYSNLCTKDHRNPLYFEVYDGYEDVPPTPRENCSCDNCSYGRDKLAMEIIRLYSSIITLGVKLNGKM